MASVNLNEVFDYESMALDVYSEMETALEIHSIPDEAKISAWLNDTDIVSRIAEAIKNVVETQNPSLEDFDYR